MKPRDKEILDGFLSGTMPSDLAIKHSVTRERIRQILTKLCLQTGKDYEFLLEKAKQIKKDLRREPHICKKCGRKTKKITHGQYEKMNYCSLACRSENSHNGAMFKKPQGMSTREYNKLRRRLYYKTSDKYRENVKRLTKESILKYPEKQVARRKVYWAVKTGKIIKPQNCSICGELSRIEAHHTDYSQPLNVIWVCKPCHHIEDRKLK